LRSKEVFALTLISAVTPLLPFIVNGGPFLQDAWEHMGYVIRALDSGRLPWGPEASLSAKWPLVNLLILFMKEVTGAPALQCSQVVPALAGLSVIPFYLTLRRLFGDRRLVLMLCSLALSLEATHMTMACSVAKITATFYPLMSSMLALTMLRDGGGRDAALFMILSVGVLFGHHYTALTFSIMLLSTSALIVYGRLRGEVDAASALRVVVLATVFSTSLTVYVLLLQAVPGYVGSADAALISSCVVLYTFLYLRRVRLSLAAAPLLICALYLGYVILKGKIHAMFFLPTGVGLLDMVGYAALATAILGARPRVRGGFKTCMVGGYMASALSMLTFSALYSFTEASIVLMMKAAYLLMPAVYMRMAYGMSDIEGKRLRTTLAALLVSLLLTPIPGLRCTVLGSPWFGGLASYDRGQYQEMGVVCDLLGGRMVVGDTLVAYMSNVFEDLHVRQVHPYMELTEGELMLVFRRSWEAGLLEMSYEWFDIGLVVEEPYNLVFCGGHVMVLGGMA